MGGVEANPPGGAVAPGFDLGGSDVESLVARLREMILSGEFAPGSIVPQVPLARSLGISTTPLREAMRQLQSEGLLEVRRNHRARVPDLDVADLHAVYAARVLLESQAIAMTAVAGGAGIRERLTQDLRLMSEAHETEDFERWTEVHTWFHLDLVSGSTLGLMPTIRNFFDRSERYRRLAFVSARPRFWSDPHGEHTQIADACLSGDGAAAARALASHLARTAIQLSATFAPEVDPAPVRIAVGLITGTLGSGEPLQSLRLNHV